jgi:hypothetical protein
MEFGEVANRVFALHGTGKLEDAVELVTRAAKDLPDHRNDLVFWQACLLAQLGRPDEATNALSKAIAVGDWWPPDQLLDPDLNPIRTHPEWLTIEAECERRADDRLDQRPAPMVKGISRPQGTIVVIQGARDVHQDVADAWFGGVPPQWEVVVPCASEPTPVGGAGWQWSRSRMSRNLEMVVKDVAELDLAVPLVLAGFSIGTAIACGLVGQGLLPASGLIAVAPSSFEDFPELRQIGADGLPVLIIYGADDTRIQGYERLRADFISTTNMEFQVVQDIGHAYPTDLGSRVEPFLLSIS